MRERGGKERKESGEGRGERRRRGKRADKGGGGKERKGREGEGKGSGEEREDGKGEGEEKGEGGAEKGRRRITALNKILHFCLLDFCFTMPFYIALQRFTAKFIHFDFFGVASCARLPGEGRKPRREVF